jgi:hypothetical protein
MFFAAPIFAYRFLSIWIMSRSMFAKLWTPKIKAGRKMTTDRVESTPAQRLKISSPASLDAPYGDAGAGTVCSVVTVAAFPYTATEEKKNNLFNSTFRRGIANDLGSVLVGFKVRVYFDSKIPVLSSEANDRVTWIFSQNGIYGTRLSHVASHIFRFGGKRRRNEIEIDDRTFLHDSVEMIADETGAASNEYLVHLVLSAPTN